MAENQLVAEALPQADEYSGMSIVDIAHAVVNWPEGSEDQQRAIAAIQARRPGIGHNMPPIAERLVEEVAPLAARQAGTLDVARKAVIVDDESAAKVTDLSVQVRALAEELKQARDAQLRPYLVACQMINDAYNPLIVPLVAAYGDKMTGLRGMLNSFVRKRDAEAAAEQARLAAEQRQREEEAAAARRAAEAKRAEGKGTVTEDLAALKAEEDADRAQQRAEAVRPAPIRSTLGQVNTRREIAWNVTDLRKTLGWMIKQPLKTVLEAEVRKLVGQYLRQLGVDAVEKGVDVPGVEAWIEKQAGIRR